MLCAERFGKTGGLFPLTPTLRPWEGERRSQSLYITWRASLVEALPTVLPRRGGEGRSEGEGDVRPTA